MGHPPQSRFSQPTRKNRIYYPIHHWEFSGPHTIPGCEEASAMLDVFSFAVGGSSLPINPH